MSNVKFVGKDKDGKEVTCFIRKPTAKDFKDAKLYANAGVAKAIKSGNFITRSQTRDMVSKNGIWTDDNEKELVSITTDINDCLSKLKAGGIKKSEAREISIKLVDLRNKQMSLLARINELDKFTIEAQADNDEFDFLLALCFLDEEGNRVFSSVDEYKEKAVDEPYYFTANEELQNIIYGFGRVDEIVRARPEYQFLIENGFVDSELRLINKDGKLVDRYGNLVDDNGNLVNNSIEETQEKVLGEFLED